MSANRRSLHTIKRCAEPSHQKRPRMCSFNMHRRKSNNYNDKHEQRPGLKRALNGKGKMDPNLEVMPEIDRENAFQLYAMFCGDVERTAHALNIRPVDVLRVADDCGWAEKLKSIIALKKSGRPGDIERAINRAINFSQAHRLRLVLDRVVRRLSELNEQDLEDYLFKDENKLGGTKNKLVTRALADLASAIEKVSAATYAALDDTARARDKRIEQGTDGDSSGSLHAAIAKAMAAVGSDNSPRALLFDAQVKAAEVLAVAKKLEAPISPLDDDNH